jgi:hypothetical protein
MMTTDTCVFSLLPLICNNGEINAFLDLILTVDGLYSFDYRLKQHNAEWLAQKSPWKKIARRKQVALKVMLVMFFS